VYEVRIWSVLLFASRFFGGRVARGAAQFFKAHVARDSASKKLLPIFPPCLLFSLDTDAA
jgi:hypothetical protein